MPPFRMLKQVVTLVALSLLAIALWTQFASDSLYAIDTASPEPPSGQLDMHKPADGIRWTKRPDRHPVATLAALPTGKPATPIPQIQQSMPPLETKDERRARLQRLAAVRDSFAHSWHGYKEHAWLQDEVAPLTRQAKNTFGGWAATLVDALDTLWIMGMKEDFRMAVKAAERIDFSYSSTEAINVFETTIRYLGGFLAAYEISGKKYPTLLKKAEEVGELLMSAFDTPNRMPITRWEWRSYVKGEPQVASRNMLVSEIGSLSLEFTKLSQLTGEMKYYDAVQRISDEFEKSQSKTKLPGMWPVVIDAQTPSFVGDNGFTLGGMSDSLYEYFPKQYMILGGALEQPRKLYEGFIDVAKKYMFYRALNEKNIPIIISGDVRVNKDAGVTDIVGTPKGQHLTCFTGGMVGIASKIFNRPQDLDVAIQLTDGCVWTYNSTNSGIGPEIFSFTSCGTIDDSQTSDKCAYTEQKWRDSVKQYWRPDKPGAASEMTESEIDNAIKSRRLPPGMVDMNDRRYILRPEAIESVFMMWRITGDRTWQEKAWTMFGNVEKHTRSDAAAASLDDVTRADPTPVDSMESFWLAETLKYFYLVFAEWDVVSLDEWVLNTEAHPLRRPKA